MKLAEALQERSDLNKRIEQLKVRLENNCFVQDGETPAEDPSALLREFDGCIERLTRLTAAINRTNCGTLVDGRSLTELIAQKDCLNLKCIAYRELVNCASQSTQRVTRTEIRYLSTVRVKDLQAQVDALSKQIRLLDNTLQENNWKTDLMD